MSLTSRVTVAGVQIDGHATLSVQIQTESAGGSTTLRMADGSLRKQQAWAKQRVTLTCSGWVPSGLDAVDWSVPVTISAKTKSGIKSWTGYAEGPVETATMAEQIDNQWTLTLEES